MPIDVASLFSLAGRVALVTGGSSGIGRAIASALAAAGASVMLVARRQAGLDMACDEINSAGGCAASVSADVGEHGHLGQLVRDVAAPFGAPDILVNAAGMNLRQGADSITPQDWDRTLALNLSAPFFLARELVTHMRTKGWGRIINLASLQSRRAFADGIAYGASKGGVCQLTRAMAEAWSGAGVNCNAIAPGFFKTGLTGPVFTDPGLVERLARQTAIGRNGRLDDLHGIAVFLAAPASAYITGQTIFVDGGFTAK